jgi:serine/threonine protein kinase
MTDAAVAESQALESLMVRVADEFIDRLNRGEQPDIEDYAARHPQIAGLLRQMLPALQLLRVPATAVGGSGETPDVAAPETACLGDFRLLREVGRGGMGVVYEAEQRSLGRRVAVKVLPFAAALDARHLQRFQNEAHAAAQLHHTHIVPVYAVGCERGVHFYAMQFIDGRNLAALIDDLRHAAGRGDAGDNAPGSAGTGAPDTVPRAAGGTERSANNPEHFRMVARLGVQAAEGLDYAHRLGVVHRDVKPANLLVDAGGNLWITDFGLAQLQSETKLTLTGDLVGTLRYMSPEQTLGGRTPLDHRTDVYSLGATLYELLTLEPVFPGRDRQELLHQIALVEPVAPRRRNPAVPPELDTVVLKALAKNPAERYASAQELADDLQRFLDNRPIQAKRPSVWQRVRKWAVRHRPWVRAAVVTAFGVLVAAVALQSWNNRQIRREHQRAEAENAITEENLRLSLQALEEGFLQVAEERLPVDPEAQLVDRQFLQTALKFYEEFVRQNRRDPWVRLETGKAYRRVGMARQLLGQADQAREAHDRSLALLGELVAEFPDVPEYRQQLALSHHQLACLLGEQRRFPEAELAHREALAQRERLAQEQPGVPAYQSELGITLHCLGFLSEERGEATESRQALQRAVACQEAALRADPHDTIARQSLSDGLRLLGYLQDETDEVTEAERTYVRARDLATQLAEEHPADHRIRFTQIRAHLHLGSHLGHAGKIAEAEGELTRALDLATQLAAAYPNLPEYRDQVAEAHNRRAVLYRALDRVPEAVADAGQAVNRYRPLVASSPANLAYRLGLAHALAEQGWLFSLTGRLPEAEQALRESAKFSEETAALVPGCAHHQEILATTRSNLGAILREAHKHPEARVELEAAGANLARLARDCPSMPSFRWHLGMTYISLAILRGELNQLPAAEAAYARALDQLTPLADQFPDVPNYRASLALAQDNRGMLLQRLHRSADAEAAHRQAITGRQRLADAYPALPGYRAALAVSQHNLGMLLADAGPARAAEAESAFRAAIALRRQLADERPNWPAYRHELATTYYRLIRVLHTPGEVEAAFTQAIDVLTPLVDQFADVPDYRATLARIHDDRGLLLKRLQRPDEAEADYRQAIAGRQRLADAHPATPGYRAALATSQHHLGLLLVDADPARAVEAETAFRAALELRRQLADERPDWPSYRQDLADTYHRLAVVLRDMECLGEAEAGFRKALDLRRQLTDAAPDNLEYRRPFAAALNHLGRFLRDHGDLGEARRLLEQAVQEKRKVLRSRDAGGEDGRSLLLAYEDLEQTLGQLNDHQALAEEADQVRQHALTGWQPDWLAARCLARGAQLTATDTRLPPLCRQALAEDYGARSVACLRQAVARGYRDGEHLQKPPFTSLSGRDDFQQLLAELKENPRP